MLIANFHNMYLSISRVAYCRAMEYQIIRNHLSIGLS